MFLFPSNDKTLGIQHVGNIHETTEAYVYIQERDKTATGINKNHGHTWHKHLPNSKPDLNLIVSD